MENIRCLFVEVEPWEEDWIREKFDGRCEFAISQSTLQETKIQNPKGVNVLSPFIHSRVDGAAIKRLPGLKLIATRSTGVDHIDLDECNVRGIAGVNVPTYGANTVAEHTFCLILALTRRVHKAYEQTTRGKFSLDGLRGIDLRDRTIGVVGTGAIGTHMIRIALGFQLRVLAYDPSPVFQMADALGFKYVHLDTLLKESDIVCNPYNVGNIW